MINIKIDNFEGPLDLLLHLIDIKKMNIKNIVISNIINEYLEIIKTHEKNNFKFKVEFLQMASELLEIKAYSVLKSEKNKEKLVDLERRILEYKIFKELSAELSKTENEKYIRFTRKNINTNDDDEIIHDNSILNIENLQLCLNNIFNKLNKKNEYSIKIDIEEEYTVENAKNEIQILDKNTVYSFSSLLNGKFSKARIVSFFMAILELYKNNEIEIIIDNTDFYITKERKQNV
ncbi:segregation and condensation protein A [Caviibacter abscessus]|uniref:segregation and condensation protein A n=1 Tax=Caviibacter abscessus TaxID=1766719 RepID=UPI0008321C02|nr:segregation/condensation protein A [Caviibacter abscessus]